MYDCNEEDVRHHQKQNVRNGQTDGRTDKWTTDKVVPVRCFSGVTDTPQISTAATTSKMNLNMKVIVKVTRLILLF